MNSRVDGRPDSRSSSGTQVDLRFAESLKAAVRHLPTYTLSDVRPLWGLYKSDLPGNDLCITGLLEKQKQIQNAVIRRAPPLWSLLSADGFKWELCSPSDLITFICRSSWMWRGSLWFLCLLLSRRRGLKVFQDCGDPDASSQVKA